MIQIVMRVIIIGALQGFVSSFTQWYSISITFVFSKYS